MSYPSPHDHEPSQEQPTQPFSAPPHPAQPYAAQPYPEQPYAAPPYSAPPYSAPPYPAQPYSAPPYPVAPFSPVFPVVVTPPPTSGLAVASLIAGLVGVLGGWCLFGVPCVAAVILGHMATAATKRGERGGHGIAIAGLILGYIFVVPGVILTALFGLGLITS
ncbi:DUF4190 domain-containing protein [Micromonospora parathelypteridis]|uniref:DUF4190 domain-containing protein n=1 Tax=Micromonospora parathelypteridis TaxID=1839617 RepID=A0A840VNU8_9ACTN|nr:DUF4190 domain-containing protein [Micromonospora parathelypteridis]MBB5478712.1 hypothetical protein [Micromonospora parathelypteridis]